MKKTKIIATIGPATQDEQSLIGLYKAGVSIIRFNFSHANHDNAKELKKLIDKLNKSGKTNLSCLLDTKGPEIRTGDLEEKINFKKGELIKIYVDNKKIKDFRSLFCDYKCLIQDIEVGDYIEIDSGLLTCDVVNKTKDYIEVKCQSDAIIGSRRHINLPGKKIKLPGITKKDKEDVLFAIENGFDFIAQSFVRTAANVLELKNILQDNEASHIKIISKIENEEGINNIDEIIGISDGVMVARGDLGIETPIEILPILQRKIVKNCLENGKFVIIATQLLESMIENPFPTRAEVSDVFNSVMQKADCLMLSGETATGKYPIETIETMSSVINEAEKQINYTFNEFSNYGLSERDIEKKMLIRSGLFIASKLEVDAILIFTKTGRLARLAAGYRPATRVFSFTPSMDTNKYLNILFGIEGYVLEDWKQKHLENFENAVNFLIKNKRLKKDSKIIAITDLQKDGKEIPILEIITIKDFFNI